MRRMSLGDDTRWRLMSHENWTDCERGAVLCRIDRPAQCVLGLSAYQAPRSAREYAPFVRSEGHPMLCREHMKMSLTTPASRGWYSIEGTIAEICPILVGINAELLFS